MSTQWFYPTTVSQYCEIPQHISWQDDGTGYSSIKYDDGNCLPTTAPLLHIANTVVNDVKMKTYFLVLTQYNVSDLPVAISGIETEISMNRGGRITDETIQLQYNGAFIGVNKADFSLDVKKSYGGPMDLWDANLTSGILTDPSFGIGVRFQSHPSWPHRESPKIDYIRIRVW
jgi:hypothetical protein